MNTSLLKNKIQIIFNNIFPKHITLEAYESGTIDLTSEGDEFEGLVKELFGVDEYEKSTIDHAIKELSNFIIELQSNEEIKRKDLLIYLLEVLIEKLNDLKIL